MSVNDTTPAEVSRLAFSELFIPATGPSEREHYRGVGRYLPGMPELEATL